MITRNVFKSYNLSIFISLYDFNWKIYLKKKKKIRFIFSCLNNFEW